MEKLKLILEMVNRIKEINEIGGPGSRKTVREMLYKLREMIIENSL
jgi:hypothetical protein